MGESLDPRLERRREQPGLPSGPWRAAAGGGQGAPGARGSDGSGPSPPRPRPFKGVRGRPGAAAFLGG